MLENFKTALTENTMVSVVFVVVGAVIGFFVSPWLRKVLKMKR